jgi:hypothetical protein
MILSGTYIFMNNMYVYYIKEESQNANSNQHNKMMKRIFIAVFMGMVLSCSQSISGQEAKSSPAESITEAEMRDHIFFLASDYLGGAGWPVGRV